MRQFPVQNGVDAIGCYHQVAIAKISVHQRRARLLGKVFPQPTPGIVDHWHRYIEVAVVRPGLLHQCRRIYLGQCACEPCSLPVQGVDAPQDLTAFPRQAWAHAGQLLCTHDALPQRFPVQPLHHETAAEAVLGLQHIINARPGYARGASHLKQARLRGEADTSHTGVCLQRGL